MPELGPLGTEAVGRTPEGRLIIKNPDGSFSTERTATAKLPNGNWINVPTIFGGKAVSEDEAVEIIMMNGMKDPETGRKLPTYESMEEAVRDAQERSKSLDPTMRKLGLM